jgi:hypothetical protein
VGSLHIEGNTFPVDQYYLEDLVEARVRAYLKNATVQRQQSPSRGYDYIPSLQQALQQSEEGEEEECVEGEADEGASSGGSESIIVSNIGDSYSNHSSSSIGGLPFVTPRLPDDSEVLRLAAAAAVLKYAPYDAMIGAGKFQPGMDYAGLTGRARASLLDYKVGGSCQVFAILQVSQTQLGRIQNNAIGAATVGCMSFRMLTAILQY